MDILHIIELLLLPITNVITWFATRNKRRNDAIAEMQKTIDLLVQKNGTMYQEQIETRQELIETRQELIETKQELIETKQELVRTRQELSEARSELNAMKSNQEKMLNENTELKRLIDNIKK